MTLMLLIAAILVISPAAYADILLEDDFSDGNADGWEEIQYGGGIYDVVEGGYWFSGSAYSWGLSCTGDSGGAMSVPDYSMVVRVVPECCAHAGPVVRFSGVDNYFVGLLLQPDINRLNLFCLNRAAGSSVIDHCYFSIEPEESYWMRLEVEGNDYRGRAWTGEIGDEPAEWAVWATETRVGDTGGAGLYSHASYGSDRRLKTHSVRFDDVLVTDELIGAMEPLTWGGLKARFPD